MPTVPGVNYYKLSLRLLLLQFFVVVVVVGAPAPSAESRLKLRFNFIKSSKSNYAIDKCNGALDVP